jgi:hypothetical protein
VTRSNHGGEAIPPRFDLRRGISRVQEVHSSNWGHGQLPWAPAHAFDREQMLVCWHRRVLQLRHFLPSYSPRAGAFLSSPELATKAELLWCRPIRDEATTPTNAGSSRRWPAITELLRRSDDSRGDGY